MDQQKDYLAAVTGSSNLVRPRFWHGMELQHGDLEQLNAYTIGLQRLMFGSLFGCGIVDGLEVRIEVAGGKTGVSVDAGLALDCLGDPVYVPELQRLALDKPCNATTQDQLWVALCGTRKLMAPRESTGEDDDAPVMRPTREQHWFTIGIAEAEPANACSLAHPHGAGTGDCTCVLLARLYRDAAGTWHVDASGCRHARPAPAGAAATPAAQAVKAT